MHYTLQTMHEDEDFRAACESAGTPDSADPDDLFHGPYFQNLDADTSNVWSLRQSTHDAGMYALGAVSAQAILRR